MDLSQLLEDTRSTTPPSERCLDAVRAQLLAAAASAKPVAPRRRRTGRRLALALAVGVLVVAGVAAGWAAFGTASPRTTFTIECGVDTFIPSQTGDPIADCRAAMAQQEKDVPTLVGWITSTGIVAVLPRGVAPPAGSTPLPAGFRQDRSQLFASQMLADMVSPLAVGCLSQDDAVAYARRQLGVAGLVDWTVKVRPPTGAAQTARCLAYLPDLAASDRAVTLIPSAASYLVGTAKATYEASPPIKLDLLLHSQLAQTAGPNCLSVAAAAALAASDAHKLGIPDDELSVTQAGAIAPGSSCAVAAMDPGGGIGGDIWAVPQSTPAGS